MGFLSRVLTGLRWRIASGGLHGAPAAREPRRGAPVRAPVAATAWDGPRRAKRMSPERKVRDELASSIPGSRVEVPCSAGVADIVTRDEVIEVKRDRMWKSAVGQVLAYSADFPGKTPRVHLFGEDTSHFGVALVTCERLGIRLTTTADTKTALRDVKARPEAPGRQPSGAPSRADDERPADRSA